MLGSKVSGSPAHSEFECSVSRWCSGSSSSSTPRSSWCPFRKNVPGSKAFLSLLTTSHLAYLVCCLKHCVFPAPPACCRVLRTLLLSPCWWAALKLLNSFSQPSCCCRGSLPGLDMLGILPGRDVVLIMMLDIVEQYAASCFDEDVEDPTSSTSSHGGTIEKFPLL